MGEKGVDGLIAYQQAVLFAGKVIRITQSSALRKHPWMCDQLCRAALSVPSSIAEGYERGSDRDTARFYRIALGSCSEVRTQLKVSVVAEMVDESQVVGVLEDGVKVLRLLSGVLRFLEERQARVGLGDKASSEPKPGPRPKP
jgi:four helix bundle protein